MDVVDLRVLCTDEVVRMWFIVGQLGNASSADSARGMADALKESVDEWLRLSKQAFEVEQ